MADHATLAGMLVDRAMARANNNGVVNTNEDHVRIHITPNINTLSDEDLARLTGIIAAWSAAVNNVGTGVDNGVDAMVIDDNTGLLVLPPLRAHPRYRVSRTVINEIRRLDNQRRKGLGKGKGNINMGHAVLICEFMRINGRPARARARARASAQCR